MSEVQNIPEVCHRKQRDRAVVSAPDELKFVAKTSMETASRTSVDRDAAHATNHSDVRGRRAAWLIGADWETLLSQPVDAIRDQFRVKPARHYPKVIAAIRDSGEVTTETPPATAMPA